MAASRWSSRSITRKHPSFFVTKLWSYFVPEPPDARTKAALEHLYTSSGFEVRPVVDAILRHPALYTGPRMVKPPVVYIAGLLRGSAAASTPPPGSGRPRAPGSGCSTRRTWPAGTTPAGSTPTPSAAAGRSPTRPSGSSPWSRRRARSRRRSRVTPRRSSRPRSRSSATRRSAGDPRRAARVRPRLAAERDRLEADAYPPLVMNAVRQLLAVSPDLQTC